MWRVPCELFLSEIHEVTDNTGKQPQKNASTCCSMATNLPHHNNQLLKGALKQFSTHWILLGSTRAEQMPSSRQGNQARQVVLPVSLITTTLSVIVLLNFRRDYTYLPYCKGCNSTSVIVALVISIGSWVHNVLFLRTLTQGSTWHMIKVFFQHHATGLLRTVTVTANAYHLPNQVQSHFYNSNLNWPENMLELKKFKLRRPI